MSSMPPNQGSAFPGLPGALPAPIQNIEDSRSMNFKATGEKKKNLLTAANALTTLGSSSEGGDPPNDSDLNDIGAGREEEEEDAGAEKEASEVPPKAGEEDNIPMSFPQRLMEILDMEENSDVIGWLPHGRGFMIFNKKRFADEVLPKHFKKTKFTSFTRKLNRWNFTRVTRGPETGAYYHECFQRGNLRLCMQMCCQSTKAKSHQQMQLNPMTASPNMAARLNMNNAAMSRLQLGTVQMPMGFQAPGSSGGLDPNYLMLQQQLEQQRQMFLTQQQQNQQQYAALAGLGQPQPLPNQPPLGAIPSVPPATAPAAPGGSTPAPAPFAGQAAAPGTPAPTPALGTPDQSNMYSTGVVNAAIHALERTNQTGYLTMLLAQEKAQAQMASLGGGADAISRADMQRHQTNIMLAQQQQLDLLAKQRMLQAAANTAQQQQQQQPQGTQKPDSPNGPEKRAKAA